MPPFTPGELTVMRLLWELGEMKPADIQRRFPEPIKNPALRSHLTILLGKGHVSRRKVGKAFFYKAVTKQQSRVSLHARRVRRQLLRRIAPGAAVEPDPE